MPFTEFYTGYRAVGAAADELIVGVEIPTHPTAAVVPQGRHARGAGDLQGGDGRRRGDAATASAAHRARQRRADRGPAAADRSRARPSGAAIEDAQRMLLDEIAPIDDIRSTAEYRRRVAANLLAGFWSEPPSRVE